MPHMAPSSPYIHDAPLADAVAAWARARADAGCAERVPAERIGVEAAVHRVTAGPVWAQRSSPAYDAAAMDGIAVRAKDTAGASETAPVHLAPDRYAVVDTGDPMPQDFDAVVMREHVEPHPDG